MPSPIERDGNVLNSLAGAEPMPMSPGEFGQFIVAEIDKWAKVVRFAGVKVE